MKTLGIPLFGYHINGNQCIARPFRSYKPLLLIGYKELVAETANSSENLISLIVEGIQSTTMFHRLHLGMKTYAIQELEYKVKVESISISIVFFWQHRGNTYHFQLSQKHTHSFKTAHSGCRRAWTLTLRLITIAPYTTP